MTGTTSKKCIENQKPVSLRVFSETKQNVKAAIDGASMSDLSPRLRMLKNVRARMRKGL